MDIVYQRLVETLRTARDTVRGKSVATNTRLFQRGLQIVLRYHDTDVVTTMGEGLYILHSGGWRTVTTKKRINDYSPAAIFQRKGTWYVYNRGNEVPFQDGMVVDQAGKVL